MFQLFEWLQDLEKIGSWIHPFKNDCCVVLYNLGWDPADYQWKKPSAGGNGKHLEFFQYSVKLGRNLLLQSKYKCPAAMKH